MKRKLLRRIYQKLVEIDYALRSWLDEHDLCEVCHKETAGAACVGCSARICYACDSGYYSDETLCLTCKAGIPPEEAEQDRLDAVAYNCASMGHVRGCPCTRPHAVHTAECGQCPCEEAAMTARGSDTVDSGYTGRTGER